MQTLKFFGTDSGFGQMNTSAYYIQGNKFVLIDCGFTVFQEVIEKIEINKYDDIKIIITHLHNDHAGSLSQILLYLYFVCHKKVTIACKCKYIQEYLDITGVPKEAYELNDCLKNLEFISTTHTNLLDSYGFKMEINNRKIVYTGDTNTIEPFLQSLENVNEFYIDVSRYGGAHIRIDDVLEVLKQIEDNGVEVYLIHTDDKEYIKSVIKDRFNLL